MPRSQNLRDYSSAPFEILVALLTIAPPLVLIYFYPQLPAQIPVFLNLRGEVEVWAAKTSATVLRVPAMALDLQLICLLMKYGTVKSHGTGVEVGDRQQEVTTLTTRLWDWLRCLIAFKMAAASLEVIFMSSDRLRFLLTPAWLLTWLAAIVSIFAAAYYGYRLWQIKRDRKDPQEVRTKNQAAREHLIGGLIYFNRDDPALFADTYLFNFANKWVYVLICSLVAYPLLVFLPG